MGSDRNYPDEAPVHTVAIDGFWIDQHPVTNRQFREFARATSHVTFAEILPDPNGDPSPPRGMLFPGSFVFRPPECASHMTEPQKWWTYLKGADWRHPCGPRRTNDNLDDHPVVHIAYSDAILYARWVSKQLPTEAEWEYAARGGLDGAEYAWGDEFMPGGRHMANTWQGDFPNNNRVEDGYYRTSPVTAFPRNHFGLRDMIGNVWEWTADWYSSDRSADPSNLNCFSEDPRNGAQWDSYELSQHQMRMPRKVIKGGSYLSAPNFCQRYRPAARLGQPINISTDDIGFRCVIRTKSN